MKLTGTKWNWPVQIDTSPHESVNFIRTRVCFGESNGVKMGANWYKVVQKFSSDSNLVWPSPSESKMFHGGPSRLR